MAKTWSERPSGFWQRTWFGGRFSRCAPLAMDSQRRPSPSLRYFKIGRAGEAEAFVFIPVEREPVLGSIAAARTARCRRDAGPEF